MRITRTVQTEETVVACDCCKVEQDSSGQPAMQELRLPRQALHADPVFIHFCPECVTDLAASHGVVQP